MTTSNAASQHPYGLLEALALNALEPDEEQAVTEHVEGCAGCAGIADGHLRTANALSQAVPQHQPPDRLRTRLLASIDPASPREPIGIGISTPQEAVP